MKLIITNVIRLTIIIIVLGTIVASAQPFPLAKEYAEFGVSKSEKIGNEDILEFNDSKQICIHISPHFLKINNVKYYNIDFGCHNNSKDYLYKGRSNIYYAFIDSNKIKYTCPLFLFELNVDDYSIFINSNGMFDNYYLQYQGRQCESNDTILIYDFFYKDKSLTFNDRGGLFINTIYDGGGVYKRMWVSSKYGIIRIQRKEEGYYVTYELKDE